MRAEACQAVGADALGRTPSACWARFHHCSADGRFARTGLLPGQLRLGPSLMIDRQLHGRVTPARFDAFSGIICRSGRTAMTATAVGDR